MMFESGIVFFNDGQENLQSTCDHDACKQWDKSVPHILSSTFVDDADHTRSLPHHDLNRFNSAIEDQKKKIYEYPGSHFTVLGTGHRFRNNVVRMYSSPLNFYPVLDQSGKKNEIYNASKNDCECDGFSEDKKVTFHDSGEKVIMFNESMVTNIEVGVNS